MKKLYSFPGGIHPPEHKFASTQQGILPLPLPTRLIIPLRQSLGSLPKCLVQVGDKVKKGQRIADAEGRVSVAVHAPTSGTISHIIDHPVAHPSGLAEPCVVMIPDGQDEWVIREPIDWGQAKGQVVNRYLQEMGVVGLGGAVFPSHLKLNQYGLETLVINGAECEPYITCDDVLMRERAEEIIAGIALLQTLLAPEKILIGIEDNKPEAIAAMRQACENHANVAEVVVIPTCYPSGGAKQLIKLLTNKEVPYGTRSTELGVQCFNVATVYSLYRALVFAEPVLSRIVTVTGNVYAAANYEVLIGTPLDELVWRAAPKDDTDGYIMGGPMMGFRLPNENVPVSKASNCFIASSPTLFPAPCPPLPCIRCGQCTTVCPVQLQPQDLYWFAKAKNMEKAQAWSLFDCIECGACAYVCPSKLPLVDYYRFAKSEIWAAQAQKASAEQARERYEFRLLRKAREQTEKAARLAAKTTTKLPLTSTQVREEATQTGKVDIALEKAADVTEEKESNTRSNAEQSAQRQAKIQEAMARATEKKQQRANLLALPLEELTTDARLLVNEEPISIVIEGDQALACLDAEKIRKISQSLKETTHTNRGIAPVLEDKDESV